MEKNKAGLPLPLCAERGVSRSARFYFKKHLVDVTVSPWADIRQSKQSKWWYFMYPGSEFPFRFDYSYIYPVVLFDIL